MKPVTVETVRARIEQIEHAINTMPGGFTLSINHEFERACLRELLGFMQFSTVIVKLPSRQEPTSSGHYGEGYLVPSSTGRALDYEDTVDALRAAGIEVEEAK